MQFGGVKPFTDACLSPLRFLLTWKHVSRFLVMSSVMWGVQSS
jgi:hypothetical protein